MRAYALILIFLLANVALGQETKPSSWRWTALEAGVLASWQKSESTASGLLRWSPFYDISEKWGIGPSVDASPQITSGKSSFFAQNYLANLSYRLNGTWGLQGSAGVQRWSCGGCGAHVVFGPMLRYQAAIPWGSRVNDVWVQYLALMRDPTVHQAILGVTIGL